MATPAPTTGLEVQKILQSFASQVDGYYAQRMEDIRLLIGSNINQHAVSTFTSKADNPVNLGLGRDDHAPGGPYVAGP